MRMSLRTAHWITSSGCVWSVMAPTLYRLASGAVYRLLCSQVLEFFLRAPTLSRARLLHRERDSGRAPPLLADGVAAAHPCGNCHCGVLWMVCAPVRTLCVCCRSCLGCECAFSVAASQHASALDNGRTSYAVIGPRPGTVLECSALLYSS